MKPDRSEILLISISLCFIIGGLIFTLMVLGRQYGTFEIPFGPLILLAIAVAAFLGEGLLLA